MISHRNIIVSSFSRSLLCMMSWVHTLGSPGVPYTACFIASVKISWVFFRAPFCSTPLGL